MRVPFLFLTAALAAAPLLAQSVQDVGLTMDGGLLTVIYGQACGPFSCTPRVAGNVAAAQPRVVVVYGAPVQIYVLAIDLANSAPCFAFPGIANSLVLGVQPFTLAIGILGPGGVIGACQQGRAPYSLLFPLGTPSGVQFQLQALAMSPTQNVPAFTIALQATTQ